MQQDVQFYSIQMLNLAYHKGWTPGDIFVFEGSSAVVVAFSWANCDLFAAFMSH